MSDRELLELAAKAVGLLPPSEGRELDYSVDGGLAFCGGGEYVVWSPLTDDGDALRLAVRLRLTLLLELPRIGIGPRMDFPEVWVEEGEDEDSATRRAIVRAAAEIGKSLQEQPQ